MAEQRTRPEGVSSTAVLTARARAEEQRRPDRLFDDPLVGVLVEAAGGADELAEVGDLAAGQFVLRTRYFDDYLRRAADSGIRQVVLLASGLDTRAFRLDWPAGTDLFELDLPDLLAFKDAVLADAGARPACRRASVPVDLRENWPSALRAAGFDPARPTAWLVEGLLMFLSDAAGDLLLARLSELSAPGSALALEHFNRAFRELPQMRPVHDAFDSLDALEESAVDDPVAWLAGHGWTARTTHQADLAATLGRPVPAVTDPALVGDARIWLVSALRQS